MASINLGQDVANGSEIRQLLIYSGQVLSPYT